ncbi:hypothetical protein [Mycobacteroides abscessus]|uniref:hypothetical protein n=1 Tax=Mycobacteroides abscessus TaxID=36809 RepID=UPI000241D10C|nr:hypothetical protein [Mycobacteroides abscessus]EHM17203.1 hypothetical protein MBOL_37890 [Mycobacteroides abscessus subsp. bolletii BD]ORA30434.1 hypothetical protein BST18_02685 [Mycobacteroides abscessus subsp. bolletii]TPF68840.1 hypothetical protein XW60_08625 [Mycobacteroides abscessus subsp. bolletii]
MTAGGRVDGLEEAGFSVTTTSDRVDTGVDHPDLVVQERTVGNNVDYAGSRIPDRSHRYVKSLRFIRLAMMRLRAPLRFRYMPYAIDAFQREGINPDEITLESARAALAAHRAARQAS